MSRLFSRFARDGLIRINQREVRILDQPALKQLLGQKAAEAAHAPRALLPAASLMLAALIRWRPPRERPARSLRLRRSHARAQAGQAGALAEPSSWASRAIATRSRSRQPSAGQGELADIKQVVVVIHGVKRDADRYYEYVTDLLERNPERARDTLVLAPRFPVPSIPVSPAWRRGAKASWEGEDSVQAAGRLAPVSSFQVLDDLLRSLDDRQRLPALAGIVLAGHSGGAQLVQRYAVLNNVDGPLRRDGLALRYVIANPSSYLYLTNERPRPDGKGYAPYERGICPTYNQYKYGTDKLPAYARARRNPGCSCATRRATSPARRRRQQPEHRLLDKTCGAEAQGSTRLARGTAYLQYEFLLASRGGKPVTLHRAGYEVRGVSPTAEHVRLGMRRPGPAGRRRAPGRTRPRPASRSSRAASSARQAPSRAPSIMTAS